MEAFIESQDLTDVWRAQHLEEKRFTCFTTRSHLSHLDLLLASPAMLTHIHDSDIGLAFKSDHSLVTVQFSLDESERGPGFWRLPNFLLGITDYKKVISNIIDETMNLNKEAGHSLLWETVQANVRGNSFPY